MPDASYVQSSFLGGEYSQFIQGRYDRPEYRTGMHVCLNGFPLETGAWARRPGFGFAQTTRGGRAGRLFKIDHQFVAPYQAEFTDGHVRFFSGRTLVDTNDSVGVIGISVANPAVATLGGAVGWQTGDQGFFTQMGPTGQVLQNRVFILTRVNPIQFSLADAITGASIDGSTFSWTPFAGATLHRILDLASPYTAGTWATETLRLVQTETTSFLLHGSIRPYALTVTVKPNPPNYASFALNPSTFNDGPYLDVFTNGVTVIPDILTGIVTLVLQLPAYDATRAYPVGAYVTSAAISYVSLVDQNLNNTPSLNPAKWQVTTAGEAVAPGGFKGSDIGRAVRLFSEPDLWNKATTYSHTITPGNIVSYNPSGIPGATTYWRSLTAGNTGNVPGSDTTNWALVPTNSAVWTWGYIVNIGNFTITTGGGGTTTGGGLITVGANTGNMTANGGLAAAFDGVNSKAAASCAAATVTGITINSYVGKDFTGPGARPIGSATVYPANDLGFASAGGAALLQRLDINLRGKASSPSSPSDGTLLGTATLFANQVTPVTVTSGDTTSTWTFVWIEIAATFDTTVSGTLYAAQVQLFAPSSSGSSGGGSIITGPGIQVELIGASLLYFTPIRTWRLGAYSGSTGFPTCGTYTGGRLWLSGAIPNRIDACVANGIAGGTVNFAPTDPAGNVAASSAISYTFNAPDANAIFWMEPDQQGILCGTGAGEWLVVAPSAGGITPFNIDARRITKIGCANIS